VHPRRPPPRFTVTRRSFLGRSSLVVGVAAVGGPALLAACGGGDGQDDAGPDEEGAVGDDEAPVEDATPDPDAPVLGISFDRNGLLIAGAVQRAPFVLFSADGGQFPDPPAELTFRVGPEGENGEAVDVAVGGGGDVPQYYPLRFTYPEPGLWTVTTEIGGEPLSSTLTVNEPGAVAITQVGEPLPAVATPTSAAPLDTTVLCTREPPCPFHEVSVDAALAEGRPVALLVSTPAFCVTAVCGPVLDVLIEAAATTPPELAIVHLEVYPFGIDPSEEGSLQPLVAGELGMTFEPALFVTDPAGTLTARLDNVWDRAELDEALTFGT
jgi:hypothetical protein